MTDEPAEPIKRPFGIYLATFLLSTFVILSIASSIYWYAPTESDPTVADINNVVGSCILINAAVALVLIPPIFKGSVTFTIFSAFFSIYIAFMMISLPLLLWDSLVLLSITVGLIAIFIASLFVPDSFKFSRQGHGKRFYLNLIDP